MYLLRIANPERGAAGRVTRVWVAIFAEMLLPCIDGHTPFLQSVRQAKNFFHSYLSFVPLAIKNGALDGHLIFFAFARLYVFPTPQLTSCLAVENEVTIVDDKDSWKTPVQSLFILEMIERITSKNHQIKAHV